MGSLTLVTDQQVQQFIVNGYLIVPAVINPPIAAAS